MTTRTDRTAKDVFKHHAQAMIAGNLGVIVLQTVHYTVR